MADHARSHEPAMNVRDAIIQRLNQRIMKMRTDFERFDNDAAEREKVGPKWNVRDLAGHMAMWAEYSVDRLKQKARGDKLAPLTQADVDRMNDEAYRKNRRMSYVMLLPQLRAAEERVMQVIGAVDPTQLIGDAPVREYVNEFMEHYDHHQKGLTEAARRLVV